MSPDLRRHRGAHPEDRRLFAPERLPALRAAVGDYSWLLTRGYPPKAALELVGNRYGLAERQRIAVARAACSEASRERRCSARCPVAALAGEALVVDGFNLLITVEAALSGALLLRCRDGCLRDLASIHGSYRSVEETEPALRLIGETLAGLRPRAVRWLLDRPVSNSGRLAARIRALADAEGWSWSVEALFDPDAELLRDGGVAVTTDSAVLDRAPRWADLAAAVVEARVPDAWRIDLTG